MDSDDINTLNCLVAIGKIQPNFASPVKEVYTKPIEFIWRHTIDGRFSYVDQRCYNIKVQTNLLID